MSKVVRINEQCEYYIERYIEKKKLLHEHVLKKYPYLENKVKLEHLTDSEVIEQLLNIGLEEFEKSVEYALTDISNY